MAGLSKLVVLFLLLGSTAQAQISSSGTGKVSQLSDDQIQQYWLQAQKSGLSESDAVKQLAKRGYDPSEIANFKKRLVKLQGSSKNGATQSFVKDTAAFLHDSSWIAEVPLIKKRSKYYGFDFFNNPVMSFEPNLNVSPPKNYIMGAGDVLTITVTGVNETNFSDRVSKDGNFNIPHAGIVNMNGQTLEQATQSIKAKMKLAYPAIATGKTQVLVTIDRIRTINITIIGEAEKPGKYTVSGMADFFNVLYLSGGPSQNGSLRKIELIRNNKVIETIDFYTFLQKGIFDKDLSLQDQDVIRFPVYIKRVSLTGEIKRPSIYELLEKETLADLIQYGGGFGDTAFKESIKVIQVGDRERKFRDVSAADYSYFIPRNADSVFIDKVLPRFSNRINITGAVQRPGNYELTDGLTLATLIKNAAGLREDAFTSRGYIKRTKTEDGSREQLTFDAKKILSGAAMDIPLMREDSVFIMAKDSLMDQLFITVDGNVRSPGTFQYRKGITLEDAIAMAGGFTNDAATHKVEVSRLEKNKSDTLANKLLDVITVDVDSSLQNTGSKHLLEPLDGIFVPRLLNYRNLGSIRLRGEVLYTGDYSLERRDESIQELIKRAGGITPYASMKDAQIYRNNLRIATTIFANGTKESEKLLLLPGDSIFIPRNEPFVEVKGAVFNQQILRYESTRFLSYISDAGGVTDKGNLRKAYIQYSNGINRKIHHFLFFRNYPKVLPGSKIIVPEKTETDYKKGLSIIEISAISGFLTVLLSAVSLFKK